MAEDFRIRTSWRTHRKRKRLLRMFGAAGVIAIEDLWSYTASEKPSGDLGGMTAEDIADEINHEGDPIVFVAALVSPIGLLDEKPGGGWVIHDWADHQHWVVGETARVLAGRANSLKRWHKDGKHGEPVRDCPLCQEMPNSSNGPDPVGLHGKRNAPSPAQPSPAQPSPAQPSQPTSTAWELGEPITSPAQLEKLASQFRLAVQIKNPQRRKLAGILTGGAVEPHEIEYAAEAYSKITETPGDPVSYFLGIIKRERVKAAGAPDGNGAGPTPQPAHGQGRGWQQFKPGESS